MFIQRKLNISAPASMRKVSLGDHQGRFQKRFSAPAKKKLQVRITYIGPFQSRQEAFVWLRNFGDSLLPSLRRLKGWAVGFAVPAGLAGFYLTFGDFSLGNCFYNFFAPIGLAALFYRVVYRELSSRFLLTKVDDSCFKTINVGEKSKKRNCQIGLLRLTAEFALGVERLSRLREFLASGTLRGLFSELLSVLERRRVPPPIDQEEIFYQEAVATRFRVLETAWEKAGDFLLRANQGEEVLPSELREIESTLQINNGRADAIVRAALENREIS